MKQTLLLTALSAALLFSNNTRAQVPVVSKVLPEVILGVKVGANFQSLSGVTSDNAYNAGFTGGAFVGVTKSKFGVQGEVLVSSAKYNAKSSVGGGSVSALYLNVPVLLEYKLVSRLWIQAGPQFNDLVSAKNNNSKDVKNSFNSSDFAGVVGLQAILPLHLVASARYVLGLTNVNNESVSAVKGSMKVSSIQLSLGFRFL